MKTFFYIIACFAAFVSSSCANKNDSFGDDASAIETFINSETINDRPHLKIRFDAMTHDFMFYGAFIPMLSSPTGHSLKGRIVHFQQESDRLVMLESPQGHSIGTINESYILLADFPIVRKDSDGVVIDFAKGMTTAFTMRNVHSRSVSDTTDAAVTSEQFRAISLAASFIKNIDTDKGVLTVSQIAQWRNQKAELVSAEFRYFLREYRPSANFTKKTFGKSRWVQYFSTPPLITPPTSNAYAYMTKWRTDKPIVFHISANTPKQNREAITDGLLFWNHIFGQELVQVKILDENLSAPHPRLNILQWVSWDNEASAYADMVVDHLTGEIMQAQIYVRSGWVIESARKLKTNLEELLIGEKGLESLPAIEEDVPMPSMFDLDDPCFKTMNNLDEVAELAAKLSENQIGKETLNILTNDILRAVIAHEMGHVLGLRHNLAASTEGTISTDERNDLLKTYLRSGELSLADGKYLSKSIMDVFSASEDAIAGAQIRTLLASEKIASSKLANIYRYDKEAIDYGYFQKPMAGDIAFCTDEDIAIYQDCRRWDSTGNSVDFASDRLNNMMTQIAIIMADTFISSIDPARFGGAVRVNDISLTSRNVLKVIDTYTKELFAWQSKASRSCLIEARLPAYGPQTEAQINEAKFQTAREQIEAAGVEQALFGLLPPFRKTSLTAESIIKIFRAHFLMRLGELKRDRENFSLSAEEQEQAFSIAEAFLAQLNNDLVATVLTAISKAQFDDKNFQLPIEEALNKIAREIILSHDGNKDLPKFTYDQKLRELAVQIMSPALGILPDWSFTNLLALINDLKKEMRRFSTGEDGKGIDLSSLSREQRQWLLEQNRVLNILTQLRGISRKTPGQ